MKKRQCIILVLLWSVSGNAATYFVRNNTVETPSSDSYDGLDSVVANGHGPWATMNKLGTSATAGNTYYILGGTYYEDNGALVNGIHGTLRFAHSGTADARIYIIGHPSYPRPTIQGQHDVNSATIMSSMYLNGNSFMTFRNLIFEYSYKGVLICNSHDITLEDCKSTHNIIASGDSNGGAYTTGMFTGGCERLIFKRCEAGPVKGGAPWATQSYGGGGTNLDGWHTYNTQNSVWDSCFVVHDSGMYSFISFKVGGYKDTVRYCNFKRTTSIWGIHSGLYSTGGSYYQKSFDSAGQIYIHHNVFQNVQSGLTQVGEGGSYGYCVDTIYFYNNTIYGVTDRGTLLSSGQANTGVPFPYADNVWDHQYVFNNIYIGNPSRSFHNVATVSTFGNSTSILDNNCFYGTAATNLVGSWGGSNTNLTTWESNSGQDIHSQYTNPYLSDPAKGDFRMSAATPTSVKTGGRTVPGTGAGVGLNYGSYYLGAYDTNGVMGGGPGVIVDTCQTARTNLVSPRRDTTIILTPPQIQTGLVKLRWSMVQGASDYHVQIATDSSFTSVKLEYTDSAPSWDAGGYDVTSGRSLLSDSTGTSYFWRVRAYTIDCGWSTWTSPWKFRLVDSVPPSMDSL